MNAQQCQYVDTQTRLLRCAPDPNSMKFCNGLRFLAFMGG